MLRLHYKKHKLHQTISGLCKNVAQTHHSSDDKQIVDLDKALEKRLWEQATLMKA